MFDLPNERSPKSPGSSSLAAKIHIGHYWVKAKDG